MSGQNMRGRPPMLIPGSQGTQAIDSTGVFDAQSIHSMIRDHTERRINVGYRLWAC
jgi:hypothetical protein